MSILEKFDDFSQKCDFLCNHEKLALRWMGSVKKSKFWWLTLMGCTFRRKVPDFQYFYFSFSFWEKCVIFRIFFPDFCIFRVKNDRWTIFSKIRDFISKDALQITHPLDPNYMFPPSFIVLKASFLSLFRNRRKMHLKFQFPIFKT